MFEKDKNKELFTECQALITNDYLGEVRGQVVKELVELFKLKIDIEAMNKIAANHIKNKRIMEGVDMITDFKMVSRFDLKFLIL